MPGPIGVVPLDRKSRRTVEMAKAELGKVVMMPKVDLVTPINPMKLASLTPLCKGAVASNINKPAPMCCASHYHRHQVDKIKDAIYTLYGADSIKSIVLDSGTQFYEDMLFAEYGRSQRILPRERGAVNREMRDFYASLSKKNLYITHEARAIYKNDQKTDRIELSGWAHTGYNTNVEIEFGVNDAKEEGEGKFYLTVKRCQDRPVLQGVSGKQLLTDEEITFPHLAMQMYPNSDFTDWMD
jgi:hypothetical protein